MKKYLILTTILYALMMPGIFGQCPPSNIMLSSQVQVDNFASDYPGCTELLDDLVIDDNFTTPINNLNGLTNITAISGELLITDNDDLISLAGLENLNTVGSLSISWNANLSTLSALESLNSVGALSIGNNEFLTTLTGLENITSIAGDVSLSNSYLLSLTGLENLSYVGGNLYISAYNVSSLAGLSSLTAVENSMDISVDNITSLTGLENLSIVGKHLSITSLNIETMEGLNNLNTVGEHLFIITNENLTTLAGLENLTSVGSIDLWDNWMLTDISALSGITSIENLYMESNNALTNIDGFSNVTSIGSINITWNPSLENLDGFAGISSLVGYADITIYDNQILSDISGLANIPPEDIETLGISQNPNLSDCSVESICYYLLEEGNAEIFGNAGDCNSVEEIIEGCIPIWEYAVQGNIFADFNENCLPDTSETGLVNWIVKVENAQDTRYAYTYDDGRYIAPVDAGTYNVTAIPPNSLWEDVCFESDIAVLTPSATRDTIEFGVSTSTFCPLLEVDVTAPFVRRCFDSNYYVNYCNSGTATAENAYVEVQLDPFFTYQNSTIAGIDLGENLYSFDLGNIDIGECGSFRIDVYVDCDSTELGQTHCVEAHIFPDSICTPAIPLWDGASIEVDARCLGDSIEFKIENVGTGDMSDSLEYIIIQDDLIYQRMDFQLDSGENEKFYKQANGAFHRLEAQQSPGHPGNSMPSVFVEGCGVNGDGEISVGYVNYYLLDEGDAYVSIDCQENVGAYDPNDKQAFPIGYGVPHYITDSTDLEYMIRFQNTGTDTAFNIVIRDTISPHLNIETLRPGVASHDYRYDIEESNIAVFHFENIMLPDSNVNEAASHGFVKFNIEQQRDNSIGTHIMNDAAIYFDFNEPIITNTVFHTVGEDFMGFVTSVITPPDLAKRGISISVFPNPFDEYTRFEVQGEAVNELQLSVYDMMGREVLQQKATHQQHITMKRNNLTPGIYVFRLMDERKQLATGKLVIK